MQEQLKALRALAEIDDEIHGLREIAAGRPRQLEPFKALAGQKDARLQFLKDELKRLRMAGDGVDADIKGKEERMGKLQVQLNGVKTNAEFQVLREQIAKLKEEVGRQEEEGLGFLSKLEQIQEEMKRVKEEADEAQKELAAAEKEVAAEVAQIERRLKELSAARAEAVTPVDPKHLAQYNRVLERLHGHALAAVENDTCQGCFMSVTSQMLSTLMVGAEIVPCKSCQRILYIPD
ncbi:MAG TPA: hypothetical protein DCM87_14240 [Planctomycetes bacterium]|nr:hypothetical protein [Planctomycetota bacterium]